VVDQRIPGLGIVKRFWCKLFHGKHWTFWGAWDEHTKYDEQHWECEKCGELYKPFTLNRDRI